MKRLSFFLLTTVLFAVTLSSCEKSDDSTSKSDNNAPEAISGHTWANVFFEIYDDTVFVDTLGLILDLQDNRLIEYDVKAWDWSEAIVSQCDVSVSEIGNGREYGEIYVSNPTRIKTMRYICYGDTIIAFVTEAVSPLLYDSLQLFVKEDGLMEFIQADIVEAEKYDYLDEYGSSIGIRPGDQVADTNDVVLGYLGATKTLTRVDADKDPLSAAMMGLMNGALGAVGKLAVDKLFEALFVDKKAPVYAEAMQEISDKLDEINRSITDLANLSQNDIFADFINKYNDNVSAVSRSIDEVTSLLDAARGHDELMVQYLLEWGNRAQTSFANNVPVKNSDFLSRFVDNAISGQIATPRGNKIGLVRTYDEMVFQSTPWERQGYVKRDNFRESMKAFMIRLASVQALWCVAQYGSDSIRLKVAEQSLKNDVKRFYDYINDPALKVVRSDQPVCQIAGAHIRFDSEVSTIDYQNHPWIQKGDMLFRAKNKRSDVLTKDADPLVYNVMTGNTAANIRNSCMKASEVKAILDFYGNKRTIHDILAKEASINIDPGKKNCMVLADGSGLADPTDLEYAGINCYDITVASVINETSYPKAVKHSIGTMGFMSHAGRELPISNFVTSFIDTDYTISGWLSCKDNGTYYRLDVGRY